MNLPKKLYVKTTALLLALTIIITLMPMTISASTPTLLMSLTRTDATAAEAGNRFTADDGVFAGVSELTAWNNNVQVTIGGTGRTPIVINNNQTTATGGWFPASVGGIENASAFQIKFSTAGFDDIRFSASQKSTGSGPDSFILAYSLDGISWVAIPDSRTTTVSNTTTSPPSSEGIGNIPRIGNDTYAALEQTYDDFTLPAAVNNKEEVFLRVVFDGLSNLGANGNTSINDIRITSGTMEVEGPELADRPDHVIINQVYGRAAGSDSAVSHSFIELYNPTDSAVNLTGMSLQYFMGSDRGAPFADKWEVLPLSGTIASNSSLLVVGGSNYGTGGVRYTIPNHDMVWNITFSNRAFSIALVDGVLPLSANMSTFTPALGGNAAIIDLVGVTNTFGNGDRAAFYEYALFDGISNQQAARRINFADYNENVHDFESIRYAANGVNDERLAAVRPRSSHDGAWGADIRPLHRIPQVPADKHLQFSRTSGFFEEAFDLELTTGFTDGTIRFTLDGSEPTNDSTAYSEPIRIENRTQTVRDLVFGDSEIIIRGTGTNGDRILMREEDYLIELWINIAETVVENGTFELTAELSVESLQRHPRGYRIGAASLNNFSITDIIVTAADGGSVIYDMQSDDLTSGTWSSWGSGTDVVKPHGAGAYAISGEHGARAINVMARQNSWNDIEIIKSGLIITEIISDALSTEPTFVPSAPVSMGTVVRAAVFDEDGNALTSSIHTQSYFVGLCDNYPNLPVITLSTDSFNLFDWETGIYQTGAGFREGVLCSTCTWVTFCVCPNSWGDANFNQRGREWERPVHFEIIEPDGSSFAQDMGLRIHGNWSRLNPQKSLRLYARDEYSPGRSTFNYDLFDGDAYDVNGVPITTFQRFLLRQTGQDNANAMMRDPLLQSAAHDLNVIRQSYRQAVVFINGEFWGYYNIRERVDEYFFNDNAALGNRRNVGYFQFGSWGFWSGDAGDVWSEQPCNEDCYRLHSQSFCLGPIHWSDQGIREDYHSYLTMWNWFNNISGSMTDELYLEAQRYIDVDNLIDYWAYCLAVANADWPGNNCNVWRFRPEGNSFPDTHEITGYNDGRWRYNLRDMDMAYAIFGGEDHLRNLAYVLRGNDYPTTLPLRRLMTNAAFRERFIARTSDIMNTNTHASVMIPKINEFADVIDPVIDEQLKRWNNSWHGNRNNWRNNAVGDMISFAAARQEQFLGQMSAHFGLHGAVTITANNPDTSMGYIRVNSVNIVTQTEGVTAANQNSWEGRYLRGSFQTVAAVPEDGYRFMRFLINGVSHESNPVRFNLTGDTVIAVEFLEADAPDTPAPPPPPPPPSSGGNRSPSGGGGSTTALPEAPPAVSAEPDEPEPHTYTTADALNILRHVAGITALTAEQIKLYDFDGNGNITTANALHVLKVIAGIL
jgi:hypothetical protein